MTQDKYTYSSSQAGSTLFKSFAEGGKFADKYFDKQAASQPMIEQFNKNTATMVAAVQERGNRNRDWIAIDNAHQEAMMEHNAHVDKINREYDLEQWAKFSQGARSLLQQGLQIRKTQQTKAGYANILKARTTNPKEYADYIANIEIFEKYKKSGETNGFIEAWKLKFKDPRLATSIIDATGWEEAAIADATLADRLAALPQRMDLLIENSKYSLTDLLPDTAILGKDAIDWDLKEAMSYTKFLEKRDKVFNDKLQPEWVTQVHNAYMGRHAEFLIDTFKPGDKFGVPYKTMLTEVQPHIDKLLNQHSLGWGQHVKRKVPETLVTRRDAGVKTYLQKGLGQDWNYTGQKFFDRNEATWPTYGEEGDTESHKRYLAASDQLNVMLKLQATDPNSGATLIELLGLVNSEVKGHRGGMTKTSEIFKKALADTDFINKIEAQARAQLKLIKDNKEKTKLNAITKKQFLIVMKHLKDFYKDLN